MRDDDDTGDDDTDLDDEDATDTAPAPDGPQPTPVTIDCGCNFTIESSAVSPETRYSVMGMLTLLFGITASPKRVDYVCLKCGKTIDRSIDPTIIKRYTT